MNIIVFCSPCRRKGPPPARSFLEDPPLLTEPPFTAFVGNLDFGVTEQDLEQFFGAQNVSLSSFMSAQETFFIFMFSHSS